MNNKYLLVVEEDNKISLIHSIKDLNDKKM